MNGKTKSANLQFNLKIRRVHKMKLEVQVISKTK
jgi:hypothetical protein